MANTCMLEMGEGGNVHCCQACDNEIHLMPAVAGCPYSNTA